MLILLNKTTIKPTVFPTGKFLIYRLGIILLGCVLLISSCKTDDDDPLTATRDDYIGLWQCDEFGNNQQPTGTYQVEIIKHNTDNSKVLIDNFNQLGIGIQAIATIDNTSITIAQQIVDNNVVSGSGYITNNLTSIEFLYYVDDGSGQIENITATYTKL